MTEILLLLLGAVLVNNVVLTQFLGLSSFVGMSNRLAPAIGMAAATTFLLTLASLCTWLVERYLLLPFGLLYLRTITFILVIAVSVSCTELVLRKTNPVLCKALSLFLPLLTVNSAVLAASLLNSNHASTFVESVFYGFGAGAGFSLVLVLFAAMRERLVMGDVPEPFQSASNTLITAGLMALAFMGFAGLA